MAKLVNRDKKEFLEKIEAWLYDQNHRQEISTLSRKEQLWRLKELFEQYREYCKSKIRKQKQKKQKKPGEYFFYERQSIIEYLCLFKLETLECCKFENQYFMVSLPMPISSISQFFKYLEWLLNSDRQLFQILVEQAIVIKKSELAS